MPSFSYTKFAGLRPAVSARQLNAGEAEIAINCNLSDGRLRAMKKPTLTQGSTSASGSRFVLNISPEILNLNEYSRTVPNARSVIYDQIAGARSDFFDSEARLIVCEATGKIVTDYQGQRYDLGVIGGPPVSAGGAFGDIEPNSIPTIVSYCAIYIDRWGNEGPPGPPSSPVERQPGQTVRLFVTGPLPPNVSIVAIYRTFSGVITGESPENPFDTSWHHVKTISAPGLHVDDFSDISGELLVQKEFDKLPDIPYAAIVQTHGGWLVAVGRQGDIFISERNIWSAFPRRHAINIPSRRVAFAVAYYDTILITCRDRGPVKVVITESPDGPIAEVQLYSEHFCEFLEEKDSLCQSNVGGIFSSLEGIVSLQPGGAQLITKGLLNPENAQSGLFLPQWPQIDVPGININLPGFQVDTGAYLHGYYLGATTGFNKKFLVLDLPDRETGNTATSTLVHLDFLDQLGAQPSQFVDIKPSKGNFIISFDGRSYRWEGPHAIGAQPSDRLTYVWRSRIEELSVPTSLACCKIQFETPESSCDFSLLAGGRVVYTRNVTAQPRESSAFFRIPPHFRVNDFQIQLSGKDTITSVHLATSGRELYEQ